MTATTFTPGPRPGTVIVYAVAWSVRTTEGTEIDCDWFTFAEYSLALQQLALYRATVRAHTGEQAFIGGRALVLPEDLTRRFYEGDPNDMRALNDFTDLLFTHFGPVLHGSLTDDPFDPEA